ncbi:MAG: hypothetical protein KBG28_02955 [Kofleriaceae bacterium]|nr:hypothetical protein [Kofleriaceae bacterium]MBP9202918.1 hypothetical protein [Kofleriaceae bacterium]
MLAAMLALAGCGAGDDGGAADAPTGPAEVELGTGDLVFEPITTGQDFQVVQGPQGGYHFVVSMRTRGVVAGNPDRLGDPSNPTTSFRAFAAIGGAAVDLDASSFTQGLDPAVGSPGAFEMLGRLLILRIADDDELVGMDVRLTVEVTDVAGRSARDERTVRVIPHPANL